MANLNFTNSSVSENDLTLTLHFSILLNSNFFTMCKILVRYYLGKFGKYVMVVFGSPTTSTHLGHLALAGSLVQ
jgi:hypothetical protein